MAAIDVLPSSPMSPGPMYSWAGFDDYLDFPSPLSTPRLAPAQSTMSTLMQAPSQIAAAQTAVSSLSSNATANLAKPAAEADVPVGPAPAPGSSPETLFRYYLAVELRKMGNPADDSTLDRYVAQHCDSFTRAMERNQASAAAAANASADARITNNLQPFKSQDLPNANVAMSLSAPPASIDPHMVQLHQGHLETVNTLAAPTAKSEADHTAHSAHTSPSASSPHASLSYRSKSVDGDDDAMSEDEVEEDENDRSEFSSKANARRVAGLRTIEETPIEGSIMGPANELRPDPETYRNLTSKEKRQLRNKISARNFRTRRKEHISHLEIQVADRDTTIEGLRQQLANVNMQNKELQEEIRSLKAKAISSTDVSRIIEALQKSAAGGSGMNLSSQPEAALNANPHSLLARSSSNSSLTDTFGRAATPSISSSPRPMSPRPTNAIAKPNTRKDVSGSSGGQSGAKSFWGGVNGSSVPTVLV